MYGHPVPGVGYKVAFDAGSKEPWLPDVEAWSPDLAEQARLIEWLGSGCPGVEPRVALTQRHPWTMTPDGDFAIDRRGPIVVAAGCSGHAFKFGPALGSLVADVAEGVAARRPRPVLARPAGDADGSRVAVGTDHALAFSRLLQRRARPILVATSSWSS